MRAIVQDRYGPPDVLTVAEVPTPVPDAGEILIRVHVASVSQTDAHIRAAHPVVWRLILGLRRPRWPTLGVEFAGTVAAVGAGVSEYEVGDEVFGLMRWLGAHAEYVAVRADGPIAKKPAGLSMIEAAAACDGGNQALATLRKAGARAGQRIVVYGASGSLGTAAVQIAKHLGAHVTGVTSTSHIELVRALGADEVVDYTRDDFTKAGPVYDAVIDAVGKHAFHWGRHALRPGGIYVETDFGPHKLSTLFWWVASRWLGKRHLTFGSGRRSKVDVLHLKELVEAGAYRAVVDRTYPMTEAVAAHRYVEAWHKAGNVVLVLEPV